MNNWFKGLLVAVGSAIVTTTAAVLAVPGQFSFTKAGLTKLAIIVVPVAAKVVWAYFQNPGGTPAPVVQISPLKGPAPKVIVLGFLALAVGAHAQDLPKNVYFAGASYNAAGAPKVAGTFGYARLLDSAGTYSISSTDVLPLKGQPSAVSTSVSTGVAQKVFSFGKAKVFVLSQIGVQTDGKNMGWDWNGGAAIDYPLKGAFGLLPAYRFDKASATENYGYRFIASLNFRYGK